MSIKYQLLTTAHQKVLLNSYPFLDSFNLTFPIAALLGCKARLYECGARRTN